MHFIQRRDAESLATKGNNLGARGIQWIFNVDGVLDP
jgi:hypothetical protein